ncbi:phosphoserine phosphatase SerB [Mangrovibacterium diazotrophicum]|uniref:Phosphoserine phosphatase n=1 Tax=Mangrovibacterium diazotrophicum TaxID=1261403 RepID=A0A419VWJ2_9BACT|nr:phosphoserine phosphatase SerB [Mangrovibacterium diazotrophicum]RKD86520.1 phosphoserine phosphatase [Mangrovibacterium diazotrophicum]
METTKKDREIILLNISGPDQAGQTASLTAILAQYDVAILDIGQAVIHENLGLGILIEISEKSDSSPILKDVLFKAHELGLRVKFTPIPTNQYREWVSHQGKDRFIITLLARQLKAGHLARVTKVISEQGLNIDIISRLSGRIPLEDASRKTKSVVEFSVRGTPKDSEVLKRDFIDICKETGVDIAFQVDNMYRRNRRLVCFDMDSTLIQAEVIDELARKAGVYDEVSSITEAAMRGELDFQESFKKRISLLKGLDVSVMQEIAEELPLTEGAERLFRTLKKFGYKTAILSGGFNYFGNFLKSKLGVDYVFANELEIENGKLTGKHVGEIVDGAKKAEMLKLLAFKEDLHLEQVIAVGDGSNDLPMIKLAGLGIAFHAKPKVKASAKNSISEIGLDAILYLIGFRDREISD